jgi:23S rRNA C2498 (ribose-2'-O)-methylase RlmM
MPRINPTISKESKEIYDSKHNFERGPFVDRAIQTQNLIETGKVELIEKHDREKGIIFTPEQEQRIIEIVKEVIEKCLKEEIYKWFEG